MNRGDRMYLLRLDDASPYMNGPNWARMERLLDRYSIKPIVGIIPDNRDPNLLQYGRVDSFWQNAALLERKGWTMALHGCTHVYETEDGGINPVNKRSEFAGLPLERQKEKIREGYGILLQHGIQAKIFYAPSHTYDRNTLQALKEETDIRVVSDTVANDVYYEGGFFFIPQQSGRVRSLPFRLATFCYHPNTMAERDFEVLEAFLSANQNRFAAFDETLLKERNRGAYDRLLQKIYFLRRRNGN